MDPKKVVPHYRSALGLLLWRSGEHEVFHRVALVIQCCCRILLEFLWNSKKIRKVVFNGRERIKLLYHLYPWT